MIETIKKRLTNYLVLRKNERWSSDSRPKILVETNSHYTNQFWRDKFTANFKEEHQALDIVISKNKFDFMRHVPNADYCFCFGLSRHIQLRGSRIKMIFFGQKGFDDLNMANIPDNIALKSTGNIASRSIAEYALGFAMLMLNRYDRSVTLCNRKRWLQNPFLMEGRRLLSNQKVGILGVGANGREIARIFSGVSKSVYGCDIHQDLTFKYIGKWFSTSEINDFMASIDILILSLPLNSQTEYLINSELLEHAKKNLILINTARGKIVNEKDLYRALRSKRIRSAVLDTTSKEPLPYFSRLWRLNNILITPHISGNINLFKDEIAEKFFDHLDSELAVQTGRMQG